MLYQIFIVASLFFSGSYLRAMQNELQFFFTRHAWGGVPAPRSTPAEQERYQREAKLPKIKNTVMQALDYGDVERAIELVKQGKFYPCERNVFKRSSLMEVYQDIKFYRNWINVCKNLGEEFSELERKKEKFYELFALLLQAGANPFETIAEAISYNDKSVAQVIIDEHDERILSLISDKNY